MKTILKERRIKRLFHFTQATNLSNIIKNGLLPRNELKKYGIRSDINDEYRYDECLDAICTSIEFPNYKMFYKLRKENPDNDWAVIELDAQVLCDFQCAYCWTNAGDAVMYTTPVEQRRSKGVFLDLFEDIPDYLKIGRHQDCPRREELHIPDRYPTNPQAEVLVFGVIPIEYIRAVYFENIRLMKKYIDDIPNDINVECNREFFNCRRDYKFW